MGNSSLIEKITIKGRLVLDAPLRIGTGEGSKEIDVYVAKDRQQTPIIPGSSLAGVLRAAYKDAHPEESSLLLLLFGREHDESDDKPRQSAIDVEDVKLEDTEITVRDGVRINSFTGTAEDQSKHNFEAVERGAGGLIEMTVTIREEQKTQRMAVESAAREIAAFLAQGICLGALSAKGFGRAHCPQVAVNFYDFSRAAAVKAWMLKQDYATETVDHEADRTYPSGHFVVDADFELNSSLLVRQEASEKHGDMPVKVEQMQHRGKDEKTDYYIIPGTSIKGVLRSRAEKILARLGQDTSHLCDLMGGGPKDNDKGKHKSRFIVEETYIEPQKGLHEHVQARNSIDRFTGGTMPGKLFGEKPLWQDEEGVSTVKIHFEIRPPRGNQERNDAHYTEWEYGLALFLLKDLSLGKVALGGGKSIGRGTLKGHHIRIRYSGEDYEIDQNGRVTGENAAEKAEKLESWAKSFLN